MKNNFYSEFDFERSEESVRQDDYRTPFQIDRDRLIHSSEFRRLQGKTQVFLPGENDYYRTRLTHSIEVSQIGRSITNYITKKHTEIFNDSYFIDEDLVESACLAHDLGHPPFGHAGERTLNNLMKSFGGFEGNGQTLRLLTDTFYTSGDSRRGMKPTRAFVDAILKYKSGYSKFDNPKNHFIYDYQKEYVNFVFAGRELPSELKDPYELNNFKSIECQIMDWADDSAYAVNDLVDSISGGFITIAKLQKWRKQNSKLLDDSQNSALDKIEKWITEDRYKSKFGSEIGEFIHACSIEERETFMDDLTNRYKYYLSINEESFQRIEMYKKIAVDLVFRAPQLHQMEFKGNNMITKMFDVFAENYIDEITGVELLPNFTNNLIKQETDRNKRARLVCDYLAGMTEAYALTNYKRMFDPDYNSISDIF
ncbi:MAG: dNTP triphosphohydrolase [Melioribacteraceae bacterium]|jgi:dGTPase|nr:dNTP triphosphohydrolase [Melioribacteraceae bacterium]